MAFLGMLLLASVALGLQATLVPHLALFGVRPDLPLVATVLLAYARGSTTGTVAGFFIGLAQDVTNPAFLGLNALTKSLLGHVTGALRANLDASSLPMRFAVLFVAVVAHDVLYLAVFTRLALSELLLGLLVRSLPTALYTALVGMWAFALLGPLTRRGAHGRGRPALARR